MMAQVGTLLRDWRRRRRLSQLDLALEAGVSARHISFVETGRAKPSAEMLLLLADRLEVPLRERNRLLLAAGFAPLFGEHDLDEPELRSVREAIGAILRGHEPNPAIAVDRHWELVAANDAIAILTDGAAPELLEPPVNALRLALHPDGVARRIVNLAQWRAHLLERLGRQAVISGDPALAALYDELSGYPGAASADPGADAYGELAVPLRVRSPDGELAFISTITSFGTATEVTVSELAIETFFPADGATAAALKRASRAAGRRPAEADRAIAAAGGD
jgi:transcriptional regulator with XRE-family HTH domain